MYKFAKITFLLIGLCSTIIETRIFSRCELANELYKIHGFQFDDVPTYVCIANSVSHYSTTYLLQKSNGLFGISDGWCAVDSYGGGCQILCKDLRDDSISDDVTCVKHIFRSHQKSEGNGFNAWGTHYKVTCSNKTATLAYIEGCY